MTFSYYGAKAQIVNAYPPPLHGKIIEPFAGSAQYSLKYFDREVVLYEKYTVVAKIWQWLQGCSPKDILSLPTLKGGEKVDDYSFDCDEAKWLVGFMINQGVSAPRRTASKVFNGGRIELAVERNKKRVADNLYKIKHWTIINGDYTLAENQYATWFIDPPYKVGGEHYHSSVNSKHINYAELGEWCKSRKGQVIVCENTRGGDWLPFKPLVDTKGSYRTTKEVIWYRRS